MSQSHDSLISEYVEFARFQRIQHLKAVESCFKRFIDSRLLEGTYTSDEVAEIIQELCQCICGDIESELINTSHMNVLLLKQLFKQAEDFGFTLKGNISEMQNEDLLEQIRKLELSHASGDPPDYKLVKVEATSITEKGSDDHRKGDRLIDPDMAHENLKKILSKKNEVIKDLREKLQIYEDQK